MFPVDIECSRRNAEAFVDFAEGLVGVLSSHNAENHILGAHLLLYAINQTAQTTVEILVVIVVEMNCQNVTIGIASQQMRVDALECQLGKVEVSFVGIQRIEGTQPLKSCLGIIA